MGVSINDIIKIGNFSFDLQTEATEDSIIGEIFHNGKVLKRVKKPRDSALPERTDTQNLHNYLKELLLTKLTSSQTRKQKSNSDAHIIDNSDKIKKKLLEILDIEENNLDLFLYKVGNNEIASSNNKDITAKLRQLIEHFNTNMSKFQKLNKFKMLTFTTDKKNAFVMMKHKESTILFLFSGAKLALIRRNIKKHIDDITSLLTKANHSLAES